MKISSALGLSVSALFCGLFMTNTSCKKKDLTPPLFKHTKWKYIKCEPRVIFDSTGKSIGITNDTTYGTETTSILYKDDHQVIFRGYDYYSNVNNDSVAIFERSVPHGNEPSGKICYYKVADCVYVTFHHSNMLSGNYKQVFEYWWTIK